MDKLVDRLEVVLQNDETILRHGNIECGEKADPYEVFAQNINAFRPFHTEKAQVTGKIEEIKLQFVEIFFSIRFYAFYDY